MRVLYLAPERKRADRITGMTFIDEELVALARRGVDAHVLSVDCSESHVVQGVRIRPVPGGRSIRALAATGRFWVAAGRPGGVPANRRGLGTMYLAARVEREAASLARTEGFDLIHSHFGWPAGYGGVPAAAAAGVPLVASFRGMDLLTNSELGYGLRLDHHYDRSVRRLLREASRTLYVSDFMRREGLALGARSDRAFTVRKGVDLDVFRPGSDVVPGPPEVLTVCNLLPRKRVDHLLRALTRLPKDLPFRLSVCGTGPEEERLRSLANELDLTRNVTFHGWVERARIPAFFARAAIFVLPSLDEASGNVLLEAQASGTPTVCMAAGGAPEYVRDGETGYVVPATSEDALARTMSLLLADEALRARLGAAARRFAETELGYDGMIDSILEHYEALLRGKVQLDNARQVPAAGTR